MEKGKIGIVGMEVMGRNLALNIEDQGYTVSIFNRTGSKTEAVMEGEGKGKNFIASYTVEEFIESLESPKRIMLMVKAGFGTDAMIGKIAPTVACILMLGAPLAAWADPPEAGPENHGLRLGLSIATARKDSVDVHTVRLDLCNVGKGPVVLVAQWPYEHNKGDCAEFFKSTVAFATHPEVQPESGQPGPGKRTSPQPERELKPGECLTIQWQAKGRRLKTEDCFTTAPYFPRTGFMAVGRGLFCSPRTRSESF